MSAFTGLENNLISSLYLWANSSHISLTRSHFVLDLVNDLVRGWLAWTLIHWTSKLPHQQQNLPFQITGLDFFRALRLMAAVDVFYQGQHHLFQKTYLDFNIETCYLLSLAVRTTERNNQENEKYKTRQRLLKEKFIPRWQDFLLLAKKRLYKGGLLTEISTSEGLSNPMKFSSKEARNSRSGGHHLGELLAAWWQVCDVNALNLSLLNHSKLLVSSFRSCTRSHGRKKHNPKRRK